VAWGVGSYFSIHLDDAQLELGRILRDHLRDPGGALAAFARVGEDYPASTLLDDAQLERAVTLAALGRRAEACDALDHLAAKWPDSKYLLERAPRLRGQLGCSQPAGSGL
jgi:TolA-binding protein